MQFDDLKTGFAGLPDDRETEAKRILSASSPLEIFGEPYKRAEILSRRLFKLFHPDTCIAELGGLDWQKNPPDEAKAVCNNASAVFAYLREKWDEYPKPDGVTVKPSAKTQQSTNTIVTDNIAYIIGSELPYLSNPTFKAFQLGDKNTDVLLIARNINNVDLNNAAESLKTIKSTDRLPEFTPEVLFTLSLTQKDSSHTAVALRFPSDAKAFRNLNYVQRLIQNTRKTGVLHAKDMSWIWRRILFCAAESCEVSQALTYSPEYIFFRPDTHDVLCTAFTADTSIPGAQAASASAINHFAELMCKLTKDLPQTLQKVLSGISKISRVYSPVIYLRDFDEALSKTWGVRKFYEFEYPANWDN